MSAAVAEFFRYAAEAAELNADTVPIEALLQSSVDAALAVMRLGARPMMTKEDSERARGMLAQAFEDRAANARDVVEILYGLAHAEEVAK